MLLAGAKIAVIHASPVNPAIAFAIILWNSSSANWATFYIFILASFLGSFLALIFFKFIYQTTTETMEQVEDEEDDERNEDQLL